MLSKVTFYILKEPTLKGMLLYACRIIEKAYLNKHQVYVNTATLAEAQNFDTQLWTFSDISFVPHEIYGQEANPDTPVIIGYGNSAPTGQNEILVNLTAEVVPFYQQFNRLIEIVPDDIELKKSARNRFQSYQTYGLQLETFNV